VRPLGVVVGYRAEARCLVGPDLRVLCSGASSERARQASERLVQEGAAGLASFGLAGGLSPDLAPGDLLLPPTVILPDGGRIATGAAWRERLAVTLERAGLRARSAPVAGSDRILATAEAKRALHARSDALAVDMESHAVAAVAARTGLPLLIVRAVADRTDQPIPSAAQAAIGPKGEVRHLAVLGGLVGRPWEVGAVLALGRSSSRGLATLRRVAALAPRLGFV
jgi:adenosylhomocysteine nucleosidase